MYIYKRFTIPAQPAFGSEWLQYYTECFRRNSKYVRTW